MPRVKRKPSAATLPKMPKGFYLKRGIWYKRIYKPDPDTGVWVLRAESTHCKKNERQAAIDYIAKRNEELEKSLRLKKWFHCENSFSSRLRRHPMLPNPYK